MNIRNTLCCFFFFVYVFYQEVNCDMYFHIPRGSNNRLKGQNQNRDNNNRVFDSQNNAKGGYNAPHSTAKRYNHAQKNDWYKMKYFMSGLSKNAKTSLQIQWTNQHGCGDADLNCNIVLQYKCQPLSVTNLYEKIRNGNNEATPRYTKRKHTSKARKDSQRRRDVDTRNTRVMNEPWEWYDKCAKRDRNKGLFTADQNLKQRNRDESSIHTRQNPQGTRRGYECPEERDYYPYFHPTDWTDIAVLVKKTSDCVYYKKESFNTKPKGECMEHYPRSNTWRHDSKYNNKADCIKNKGTWVDFSNYLEILPEKSQRTCTGKKGGKTLRWAIPYRSENIDKFTGNPNSWKKCLVLPDPPDCKVAPYSRSNHLGNGAGVQALNYDWAIPRFPSGQTQRCVLRIRYNISTNDYDPKKTFSDSNKKDNQKSPIVNDPEVSVGKNCDQSVPLQLAINTAQFGRTFEDRSHVFKILPRTKKLGEKKIYNINVRGKRGNIVQVYPAVEYDFSPKRLVISRNDFVHIQWTGSNSNPHGNAGEGRRGTDRSNLVDMVSPDKSIPIRGGSRMFKYAQIMYAPARYARTKTGEDIAIAMATSGHFTTADSVPTPFKVTRCNRKQAAQLDCYPASFEGMVLRMRSGTYYFMCSRNNNFTNRSQKSRLVVK